VKTLARNVRAAAVDLSARSVADVTEQETGSEQTTEPYITNILGGYDEVALSLCLNPVGVVRQFS